MLGVIYYTRINNMKSTLLILKLELENSLKYLDSRKDKLTIGECKQKLGNLKLIINQFINKYGK